MSSDLFGEVTAAGPVPEDLWSKVEEITHCRFPFSTNAETWKQWKEKLSQREIVERLACTIHHYQGDRHPLAS